MRPGFAKAGAPFPALTPSTLAAERQRSCRSGCGRSGCFAVSAPAVGRGDSSPASGERAAIHGTPTKGEHHEHQEAHHLRHQHQPKAARATGTAAGVAFENKDGSFTFKLDILPQTKFQLREEKPARARRRLPPSSGSPPATRAPCPGCTRGLARGPGQLIVTDGQSSAPPLPICFSNDCRTDPVV